MLTTILLGKGIIVFCLITQTLSPFSNIKKDNTDFHLVGDIIHHYAVGELLQIIPLTGGRLTRVFGIQTSKGNYVLRKDTVRSLEEIKGEILLIEYLKENEFSTPGIIKTQKGQYYLEYRGDIYRLWEYMPGSIVPEDEGIDLEKTRSAAYSLARYHFLVRHLSGPKQFKKTSGVIIIDLEKPERLEIFLQQAKNRIKYYLEKESLSEDYKKTASIFLDQYDYISRNMHILSEYLTEERRQRLEKLVIHGDYFPPNVLFQKNQVSAVIDWDLARYDVKIYDLVTFVERTFSMESVKQFVEFYLEIGSLSEEEVDAIPEMCRAVNLQDILLIVERLSKGRIVDGDDLLLSIKVTFLKQMEEFNWTNHLQDLKDRIADSGVVIEENIRSLQLAI